MPDHSMDSKPSHMGRWKRMGFDEKKTAVHEEMKRMNQLPANSSYATHRLRVLNKVMQLMSAQVTSILSGVYQYHRCELRVLPVLAFLRLIQNVLLHVELLYENYMLVTSQDMHLDICRVVCSIFPCINLCSRCLSIKLGKLFN